MKPLTCRRHITRWPALLLLHDTMSVSCIKRTQLGLLLRIRHYGLIVLGILPLTVSSPNGG